MTFPIRIHSIPQAPNEKPNYLFSIHGGLTVLLGPNGSGKTQLMRSAKLSLDRLLRQQSYDDGTPINKKVRFISAGRIGMLEQYRSAYNGNHGSPRYEEATYGSHQDRKRRHNFETLQGDFLSLSQRPDIQIKIRERLKKLFKRDIIIDWDAGNLKISFSRTGTNFTSYSSAREASGLIHLVGLLTALYDDEVGILLIDEPEVSLHPQLQAFLLDEMVSVAGYPNKTGYEKIILISTHATEFIRLETPNHLTHLIFCQEYGDVPVQVQPEAGELHSRKVRELVSRMGQEHKLSLFARSPLLVEGPSDAIICGAIASKLSIQLEAGGSQILPVIGKGEFPSVLKLFRLMGKTPLVLADCDALADGTDLANSFLESDEGLNLVNKLGFSSGPDMSRKVYKDFCDIVSNSWSEIAPIAEEHHYFAMNKTEEDETDKRKKRAAMVALLSNPTELLQSLENGHKWVELKSRLEALLGVLQQLGCFILSKGTIEDYYANTDYSKFASKPDAAVSEAIRIHNDSVNQVEDQFEGIAKCLRNASTAERLNEGELLLDLLLACAAPLQARLKAGFISDDPNNVARGFIGDMATLFDFSWTNCNLNIKLNSRVLDVTGLPITVSKDEDLVTACKKALLPS